jgi:hypothetical protein
MPMPELSDAVIVALISVAGSAILSIPGVAAFIAQRRKTSAETAKINAEASKIYADGLAEAAKRELENSDAFRDLTRRMSDMEEGFDDLVEVVLSWSDGIDNLSKQVSKYETPCWEPTARDKKLVMKLRQSRLNGAATSN